MLLRIIVKVIDVLAVLIFTPPAKGCLTIPLYYSSIAKPTDPVIFCITT